MSSSADVLHYPVLYFNPRTPRGLKPANRQYLLWPALAYRVVAPQTRDQRVNILEKAVLGLHRAGITRHEDLGNSLLIAAPLAAHIVTQLKEQGYLKSDGHLTPYGEDVLERSTPAAADLTAGFVFQDPWTGKIWDRFVERLSAADVELEEAPAGRSVGSQRPILLLGQTGRRQRERLVRIDPPVDATIPPQPQPTEILRAVQRHRRKRRQVDPFVDEGQEELAEDSLDHTPNLARVTLVEDRPRRVWLTTFLFVPVDTRVGADWQVCDPFGLGLSRDLHQWVEREMRGPSPLGKVVRRLVGEQVAAEAEAYAALVERMNQEAHLVVRERLTGNCEEELLERMCAMERARIEAVQLGEACEREKLEEIVSRAQKALECLFGLLRKRFPTRGAASVLTQDARYNMELINRIAGQLGVLDPLPPELASVRNGKIHWAAENGTGSLRPLLLATLLVAVRDSCHPLRVALRCRPRLLHEVNELAGLRDEASHAFRRRSALTWAMVEEQADLVYEVLTLMMENQPAGTPA